MIPIRKDFDKTSRKFVIVKKNTGIKTAGYLSNQLMVENLIRGELVGKQQDISPNHAVS